MSASVPVFAIDVVCAHCLLPSMLHECFNNQLYGVNQHNATLCPRYPTDILIFILLNNMINDNQFNNYNIILNE